MKELLEDLMVKSTTYSLIIVALIAFLESLAIVGLVLPGTVAMVALGVMIGSGKMNFWQAWIAGTMGCLFGDWTSFWIGWRFKKFLYRLSFMKKNKVLLDKTEYAIRKHSMFTILIGRFVGPMRPLVAVMAGMFNLPIAKFIAPNIIGCLFWPLFYYMPGILAGAAVEIPVNQYNGHFKWLLMITAVLLWLAIWLFCHLWRNKKSNDNRSMRYLPLSLLFWLAPLVLGIVFIVLIRNPLMPIYSKILLKVISR